MAAWIAALVLGAAPRRVWPRLERHVPIVRTAAPAGLLVMLAGFFLGFGGFFTYATTMAAENNSWMQRTLAAGGSDQAAFVPYGMSILTLTGHSLGVSADYVVLASRRKAEWTAGATIMTRDQWYRLGEPYDLETPSGLRTAYPLTKFDSVEVVRRGIEYELPRLSQRSARNPSNAPKPEPSSARPPHDE
ncbi:MAG: hypothetical protein HY047_13550 [Acidobacteria bacterium]|nr:hypothetical protein [Acidobacteriota bacterium]